MSVDGPPIPTEDQLPACRRACLAYDAWLQAGASDQEAREAAVAAVQTVPAWREANRERWQLFEMKKEGAATIPGHQPDSDR